MSRRGLLWSGAAFLGGYGVLSALGESSGASIPRTLRKVLDANGEIAEAALPLQSSVPRYPHSAVSVPRLNGDLGLAGPFSADEWRLRVEGIANEEKGKELTLADIKALPRTEMTTELCCIEGWSIVVRWAGARFRDFIDAYPPITDSSSVPGSLARYVALETPDGNYFVGLDMPSARHPDTLLCYEMNGLPLTLEHGAPLRLAIPIKYGIKNIKRIGTIRYTNERPRDAWAEAGYDWDAGL